MNKEVIITNIVYSVESATNFISTNCNSLKDYLAKRAMEEKNNGIAIKLETGCSKCLFTFLNVFYLIVGLLIIAAGATGQLAFVFYDLTFEYKLISVTWIVSGAILFVVSIFGIISACKNSVASTNFYGILMIVAFVVQLSTAIVGFTLISESEFIARHTLGRLIYSTEYSESSAISMDYIQETLQCCGIDSANDWSMNLKYNADNYDYEQQTTQQTPPSCCVTGSGYRNFRCENVIQKGCIGKVYEITLQLILMIDSFALAVAVLQIVGIVGAFVVARIIRRAKTFNVVKEMNIQSDEIVHQPTFVGYTELENNE